MRNRLEAIIGTENIPISVQDDKEMIREHAQGNINRVSQSYWDVSAPNRTRLVRGIEYLEAAMRWIDKALDEGEQKI